MVSWGDVESAPGVLRQLERVDVVIHNHPSGVLAPSKADLAVAGILGEEGVGFYIVDNEVRHVYVVVEPLPDAAPHPAPGGGTRGPPHSRRSVFCDPPLEHRGGQVGAPQCAN